MRCNFTSFLFSPHSLTIYELRTLRCSRLLFLFFSSLLSVFSILYSAIFFSPPLFPALDLLFLFLSLMFPFCSSLFYFNNFFPISARNIYIIYFFCILLSCVTVNSDPFVPSDELSDALHHLFANELVGCVGNIQSAGLSHHRYKDVWLGVEQIADQAIPLRDVRSRPVKIWIYRYGHLHSESASE